MLFFNKQSIARPVVAVIFVGFVLVGCAGKQLQWQRDKLSGQPEPYKDGYTDGCSSGTKAAGNPWFSFKKDVMRFGSDSIYAQGWTDGFNVCKSEYESTTRSMGR